MLFNPRRRLDRHLIDVLDDLRFELASARLRWQSHKRDARGAEYLQLGCGDDIIDGFLNTDHPLLKKSDAPVDARFQLPFNDQTFKGVYAHHIIEHLDYQDATRLFSDIRRVLVPGGIFRMIVPDLEIFLTLYRSNPSGIGALYPTQAAAELTENTPLEIIDHTFRGAKFNRHLSSWDFTTAELRLRQAGFAQVVRKSVNKSADDRLAGHDKEDWAPHSLYVEAVR